MKQSSTRSQKVSLGSSTVVDFQPHALIAETTNPNLGQFIGRYRIVSLIGKGGMGEVYLAEDTALGRRIALKVLARKENDTGENFRRFEQEARAASALNHPNIMTVYDVGQSGSLNFIVTEFVEGEPLSNRLNAGKLELPIVIDIIHQVANALVVAHTAGIVHRDIKPKNIMVRHDGLVKVIDFGLVKLLEAKTFDPIRNQHRPEGMITEPGMVMGTPSYMSPEQAQGSGVDARSDIFSLGIVLYEMITGHLPYSGSTYGEVIAAILTTEPPPLSTYDSEIPIPLAQIVSKALRKERGERYQTIQDLQLDLNRLRDQMRIGVEPTVIDFSLSGKHGSRNCLPVQPNSFIGREDELLAIEKILLDPEFRLLTLTGAGGSGKTRLGLQATANLCQKFKDGFLFIPLASIREASLVIPTIAKSLGITGSGSLLAGNLKHYLHNKQILLVLDNFEHITAAAPDVAELLSNSPELKILVTSRTVLHLRGECEFPVSPLSLPDNVKGSSLKTLSECPSVALFTQRALAADPSFKLSNEDAMAVAEICIRVDGLPLAIELAAARVKMLSPRAILVRLGNRLNLLKGGAADLPARQQAMRTAIAWSYELLDEDERALFKQLSVFVGGFTLTAAEQVCIPKDDKLEIFEGISSLFDKSLLRREKLQDVDGEPRFSMLETIREYAVEQFQTEELHAAASRHASFFLCFAERDGLALSGLAEASLLQRLEADHNNIDAALKWFAEREVWGAGLQLSAALWRFWWLHGHLSRGSKWLKIFLKNATALVGADLRARALRGLGVLTWAEGDYESATLALEESLILYRQVSDPKGIAGSLTTLGSVSYCQGEFPKASAFLEEGLAVCRKLNDKPGIARMLNILGIVAHSQGDYERATVLHTESLAIKEVLGDQQGVAISLSNLGVLSINKGEYDQAAKLCRKSLATFLRLNDKLSIANSLDNLAQIAQCQSNLGESAALFTQSLAIFEQAGDRRGIALSSWGLGAVALRQGQVAEAASHFRRSLILRNEVGDREGLVISLLGFGDLALHRNQFYRAVKLFGATETLRKNVGVFLPLCLRNEFDQNISHTRQLLGERDFEAAWLEGSTLSQPNALAVALQTNEKS